MAGNYQEFVVLVEQVAAGPISVDIKSVALRLLPMQEVLRPNRFCTFWSFVCLGQELAVKLGAEETECPFMEGG